MKDWTTQVTEFQRAWMEQQQKFLSDWIGNLQGGGAGNASNTWKQSVSAVEKQVDGFLDLQKQSLRSIAGNLEQVDGAPEAYTHWVQQLEEGLDMWADMQHRLWEVWFDMLRSMEPVNPSSGNMPVMNWQDMAERTMSLQQQWLSDLTSAPVAAAKRSGKPSAAKKATTGNGRSGGQKAH